MRLRFFVVKLKLSAKTLAWLLAKWRYSLLALTIAFLFFELMYWLFNMSVLGIILGSGNVSFTDKIAVLLSPFHSVAAASGIFLFTLMLLVSLTQGVAIAALTYIFRHQNKIDPSLIGGSSVVSLLALLGLGCPACGTSLLTPLVAVFVSGSAVAISEKIMNVVLPFALTIGIYGLYVVGLKLANVRVTSAATENKSSEPSL